MSASHVFSSAQFWWGEAERIKAKADFIKALDQPFTAAGKTFSTAGADLMNTTRNPDSAVQQWYLENERLTQVW